MRSIEGFGSDICAPPTRAKIAESQRGPLGYQWRGDEVEYGGIHKRARASLPPICALADDSCRGYLEVALKHEAVGPLRIDRRGRGEYSANLEDYWRLCRSHHNRYDGKEPPPETHRRRS